MAKPHVEEMRGADLLMLHDKGYIQEANRHFFHPLGLHLGVRVSGSDARLVIYDDRTEPEGSIFDERGNAKEFKAKAEHIAREMRERYDVRFEQLGWAVQPVSEIRG